ncbi:cystatin-A/B, partial [Paragonimus westermani]
FRCKSYRLLFIMMKCGGIGQARAPSAEEKQKLETVLKKALPAHLGSSPTSLEVVEVSTQVVAGTNYFAKVKLPNEYIHTRIYEKLPCHGGELELHSIQRNKTHTDPLVYF